MLVGHAHALQLGKNFLFSQKLSVKRDAGYVSLLFRETKIHLPLSRLDRLLDGIAPPETVCRVEEAHRHEVKTGDHEHAKEKLDHDISRFLWG